MIRVDRKSAVYSLMRPYVDTLIRASFRRITVEGKERLPRDGTVLLVPNHCNTLMDALVVLQCDHGPTAFGARADIFRKPFLNSVLRRLRMLPLARVQDGLEMVRGNAATFVEIVDCLDNGVPFCIFGEGRHYPGYEVHPIRSGVFRLAQMTRERTSKKVWIVPVGLSYSDFYHFRNDVVVRYGVPLDADTLLPLPPRERSERLAQKIQELVSRPSAPPFGSNMLLKVLAGPLFVVAALASLPEWLSAELIVRGLKDKAWSNTVRFACSFLLMPLLAVAACVIACIFLPWYLTVVLTAITAVSPYLFYDLLRLYRE